MVIELGRQPRSPVDGASHDEVGGAAYSQMTYLDDFGNDTAPRWRTSHTAGRLVAPPVFVGSTVSMTRSDQGANGLATPMTNQNVDADV